MPESPSQIAYRNLLGRLERFRRKDRAYRALLGLGLALTTAAGASLLLLLLESTFYLPPLLKVALACVATGCVLVPLLRLWVHPLLYPESPASAAARIEIRFGQLRQRLIGGIQLWNERGDGGVSRALIEASVAQTEALSQDLDFEELVDRTAPMRSLAAFFVMVLMLSGLFLLWPNALRGAAHRLSTPLVAYVRPPDTRIALRPGDAEVIAGEPFQILAVLSGVVPLRARLALRESDVSVWTPVDLAVRNGRVTHRFPSVVRSFEYRLQAHDSKTPSYTLTVRPRPMVTRVSHTVRFPEYTGLPTRSGVPAGDILAPRGSEVDLLVDASLPLSEAVIRFEAGKTLAAVANDRSARVSFPVSEDGRYTIGLYDRHLIPNKNPVTYRVVALADLPPELRLLSPADGAELGESMQAMLSVAAHDDYGVAGIEIRYRLPKDGRDRVRPVPLDSLEARELTQSHRWDLSRLSLLPGDQVHYRVRVTDNNSVSGPGIAETETFTLRFPSLFEIHEEVRRTQDRSLERMAEIRDAGDELAERVEQAARKLSQREEIDWEQKKDIEELLQEQKQAGEVLEQTADALEKALERLEESGLLAEETLEKLQAIQDLMKDLRRPELDRAMQSLQEAMDDVDPNAVREALETFRLEHEAFQKNLDRTLSLLRQVRDQQTLDALTRRMEALSEEQDAILEHVLDPGQSDDLAERETRLSREAERLEEALNRAADEITDPADTGESLNRISAQMKERDVAGESARAGQELRSGKRESARSRAGSVSEDLEQLAQEMRRLREGHMQLQKDRISRELASLLHDLTTLSQRQEETARKAADADGDSGAGDLALEQARNLTALDRLTERLVESTQKTLFLPPSAAASLGKAALGMQKAAGQLQSGKGRNASRTGTDAMGELNAAALMVRGALADLSAASSATGFEEMLQKMQNLADRQSDLNAQSEGLFGQHSGGGILPQLGQLAAEQLAIRQALEALREKSPGEGSRMLGDLGHVASEMAETERDLQRGRLDRQTLDRQRRIRSRLLDAQRSIRSRGKSRKRESRSGTAFAYRGPGSLPPGLGESDNPLRRRLAQALREGYPPEYQVLIRRYFEALIEDARTKESP